MRWRTPELFSFVGSFVHQLSSEYRNDEVDSEIGKTGTNEYVSTGSIKRRFQYIQQKELQKFGY